MDTVNAALSTDLLQIGTSLLTVIGSFVMLLMLSPLLSGVFFLTVPLSVLLTRLQMKHIHPLFRRRSQELGALNSFAEERVSCQRAIRVYGVEAADLRQFAEKNDAASETYYKADCASTALGPSVNFINNLSLAAVSVFGALLYLGGGLSLGALSSFVLYSRKFSGPIRETAELLSDLQASVAAAERVLDLLDQPAEDGDLPGAREPCKLSAPSPSAMWTSAMTPPTRCCGTSARTSPPAAWWLWWGPPGPARPPWSPSCCGSIRPRRAPSPLTDCPSSSTPGTASGVAWPSSCRTAGCAAAPSRKTSPTACRALPRAQIEAAAKAACIHSFLSSLPDGYDTALTDSGAGLSKGQRQLLALAPLLPLQCGHRDLGRGHLGRGPGDRGADQRRPGAAAEGRTCFLIAHRLATVRTADASWYCRTAGSPSRALTSSCWMPAASIGSYTMPSSPDSPPDFMTTRRGAPAIQPGAPLRKKEKKVK